MQNERSKIQMIQALPLHRKESQLNFLLTSKYLTANKNLDGEREWRKQNGQTKINRNQLRWKNLTLDTNLQSPQEHLKQLIEGKGQAGWIKS